MRPPLELLSTFNQEINTVMVGPIFALALYGLILLIALPLPIILGFTVVRADANRLGEPGWVWALLTIPLGWLAVLAYVVVRALLPRR